MKHCPPIRSAFNHSGRSAPARLSRLAQAALAFVTIVAAPAQAAEHNWSYAAGCVDKDFTSTCWSSGSVPGTGDSVFLIPSGGTAQPVRFANLASPVMPIFDSFAMTSYLESPAILRLERNTLQTNTTKMRGNGESVLEQTGGVHVTGGLAMGYYGRATYEMRGGSLTATDWIGLGGELGLGTFNQYAGSTVVAGRLDLGASWGVGQYVQAGGVATISSIGFHRGDYILRAGTLDAGRIVSLVYGPTEETENVGAFTMEGGTLNLRGPMTVASLDLSGGQVSFTGTKIEANDLSIGVKLNISQDPAQLRLGAGQAANVSGMLKVGVLMPGTLLIDAGGRLFSKEALLGELPPDTWGLVKVPGGIGTVRVAGAGAAWQNTGNLVLGGNASGPGGRGDLTVADGGAVNVGGGLHLWSGSALQIERAGALTAGALTVSQGSVVSLGDGVLSTSSGATIQGTLNVAAGSANRIDGQVVLTDGARLDVQTQVSFNGPVTFEGGAHIHNVGEIAFNGRTVLQPGVGLSGDGAKYFYGSVVLTDDFAQVVDSNALALMPGSVLEIDLGAPSGDVRIFSQSWVFLAGGLKLSPVHGFSGQAGDSYAILGAGGGLGGSFTGVDTSAFALSPGLSWDFSQLNSAGIVGIHGSILPPPPIPEPGTWALMLAGLAAVGRVARQRRVS